MIQPKRLGSFVEVPLCGHPANLSKLPENTIAIQQSLRWSYSMISTYIRDVILELARGT